MQFLDVLIESSASESESLKYRLYSTSCCFLTCVKKFVVFPQFLNIFLQILHSECSVSTLVKKFHALDFVRNVLENKIKYLIKLNIRKC